MTVSYKEIRKRIQALWPQCRNVWLNDLEYEYPAYQDIETVIKQDHTERLTMRGYQFDCDDFSLQLSAAVSRYVGQNKDSPWPFGQIKGRSFQHLTEPHSCNICLLEDKILIIEPQTDQIFEASATLDKVFYVAMP